MKGTVDQNVETFERKYRIRRVERILEYAGLVAAGIFLTIAPSALVLSTVSHPIAYFFSVSMIVSAAVCLYGPLTDKWIGEFTGIFLLSSSLAFYGLCATIQWQKLPHNPDSYVLLGFASILFAFALALIARWGDLRRIKQHATEVGQRERADEEAGD